MLLIPTPQPDRFAARAPRTEEPSLPLPYTLAAPAGAAAALEEQELRRARAELQRVERDHADLERQFEDLQAAHAELTERERQFEDLQAAHAELTERERSDRLALAEARSLLAQRDVQIAEQNADIDRIQASTTEGYLGPFGSDHAVHQAPPPGEVVVGDRVTFHIRGAAPIRGSGSERISWRHGDCLRALTAPRGVRVVFEAVSATGTVSPTCNLGVHHVGAPLSGDPLPPGVLGLRLQETYPLTIRPSP